jgi:septal ring factor EnvC (AmiA/AmiB activator)
MKRLLPLLVLLLQPAWGQTAADLRDARRQTRQDSAAATEAARAASAAQAEERRLAEARVAAARAMQQAEARLASTEATARIAAEAAQSAAAERTLRAAALAPFLPLLHRLERWPAESLLAVPAPPDDALRGLLAMQALIRHAGAEAEAFRQAAERATATRRAAEAEAEKRATARAEALAADTRLEAALEQARNRRAEAQAHEDSATRRAREAASRVTDLEQAMARLEAERRQQEARSATRRSAPPPPPPTEAPPGRYAMPVAGQVAREFGATGEAGPARGMTMLAAPRARVVAPCAGRVAFAGNFRSYGRLVIIDCGAGVHLVLARLERLETATGERVLTGEPVGSLAAEQPQLYVELRRNGQPTDPRGLLGGRG